MVKLLQGLGYLVSSLSVVALGIVAWRAARDDETLLVLLILGVAASLGGMLLRWMSFLADQREKEAAQPIAMQNRSARADRGAPSDLAAGISVPLRS